MDNITEKKKKSRDLCSKKLEILNSVVMWELRVSHGNRHE